jgi:hypothetical protein
VKWCILSMWSLRDRQLCRVQFPRTGDVESATIMLEVSKGQALDRNWNSLRQFSFACVRIINVLQLEVVLG